MFRSKNTIYHPFKSVWEEELWISLELSLIWVWRALTDDLWPGTYSTPAISLKFDLWILWLESFFSHLSISLYSNHLNYALAGVTEYYNHLNSHLRIYHSDVYYGIMQVYTILKVKSQLVELENFRKNKIFSNCRRYNQFLVIGSIYLIYSFFVDFKGFVNCVCVCMSYYLLWILYPDSIVADI